MTQPTSTSSPASAPLFTEPEVLAQLRAEIASSSQIEVARRYSINPTQLNDILAGRAKMSRSVAGKLRWLMVKMYKRADEGGR